jgi:hypothetical protein
VLGLVFCALVVSAALPLRQYLSQRGQIAAAEARQEQDRARVRALQDRLRQLQDPAYVKAQARTRLHFVLPGETPYVLITPSAAPRPPGRSALGGVSAPGPEAPWYSQLWSTVRVADQQPAKAPAPKATPAR